jgi:hypothetical protein
LTNAFLEAIDCLTNVSSYQNLPNFIMFYTLTGMKEGGISFEELIEVYKELAQIIRHMPNPRNLTGKSG